MKTVLTCATRQSPLALWQAEHVKQALEAQDPELSVTLLPLITEGDRRLEVSLAKIGGKGLFIKAVEDAVLEGRADFAVHSMKDLPAQLDARFTLAACLKRGTPWDALVSQRHKQLADLPSNPVIGTSSLRRAHQVTLLWPQAKIVPLRGNVGTRLKRMSEQGMDAIVLAAAGLERLGLTEHIIHRFKEAEMLPSVGQGVLGVACLSEHPELIKRLAVLNDAQTQAAVWAERALNHHLGGDCHTPLAGFARHEAGVLHLKGALFGEHGAALHAQAQGAPTDRQACEALGFQVAQALLEQGAAAWLRP